MLEEEKVWMQRQSESLAEKRAVHLIAEDIQLDVRLFFVFFLNYIQTCFLPVNGNNNFINCYNRWLPYTCVFNKFITCL